MRLLAAFSTLFVLITVIVLLIYTTGCAKDYSYERTPLDTILIVTPVTPSYTSCLQCKEGALADSTWQFTIDGALFCGKAEKAILPLERTVFTFFGHSACSKDSGFVASVYVENEVLNTDKKNLQAKLGCYYYDRIGSSHLFVSQPGRPLQMVITEYVYQTGMATGTFSGYVTTNAGTTKEVKNGRFRIRL